MILDRVIQFLDGGNNLLKLFLVEYIIVCSVFVLSGSWNKMLYYIGASILTLALLLMK